MDSAFAWKQYYADERERLGSRHLGALIDEAAPVAGSPHDAVVFPHTRLEVTGDQIASAVASVLAAGADRVLALGVLHGARRSDAQAVARARAGDADERQRLRGVHDESGLAAEEFSLDAFTALLELAAGRAGRDIRVDRRYPFLVGDDPSSLPGLDELAGIVEAGAMVVATTDPIHHGHAYGTAPGDMMNRNDPATGDAAMEAIERQVSALSGHRFGDFQRLTEEHRSDFRDVGPVLACLMGPGFEHHVHRLDLVDYSAALRAPEPTWVAGALVTVGGS